LDKCARYRARAKDALIKRKALEVELNELRTNVRAIDLFGDTISKASYCKLSQKADEGNSTKHNQRAVDAEAALEKALEQCELFKEEVNTLKTMVQTKTSELDASVRDLFTCLRFLKRHSFFSKARKIQGLCLKS
jgi:hypothetical protein